MCGRGYFILAHHVLQCVVQEILDNQNPKEIYLIKFSDHLHACIFPLPTYEVKSEKLCFRKNNSSLYTHSLRYKHLYRTSVNEFVLTSKDILLHSRTGPKQKILTLLYFLSSSTYLYFYFSLFFLWSFVFLHPFSFLSC